MPNILSIIISEGVVMDVSLEDILKFIKQADDKEISEIMEAVRCRFAVAFPDWEVLYLSCPKNDSVQRKQTLKMITKYFNT